MNEKEYSEKNNKIINEIMTGHAPVFLLTNSIASLNFLPELCNNYRYAYMLDSKIVGKDNFLYFLIQKTVVDEESKNKLLSYFFSHPEDKQNILKNVLLHLSAQKNDILLLLGNMDEWKEENDFKIWDTLLKNCPDNLKIVFIGKMFLPLSYSFSIEKMPKMIPVENENGNHSTLKLTEEEKNFLKKIGNISEFTEKYCEEVTENGKEIAVGIFKKDRNIVLKIGDIFYKNNEYIIDFEKNEERSKGLFFDSSEENLLYALENGYRKEEEETVGKTMEKLWNDGYQKYLLSFVKNHKKIGKDKKGYPTFLYYLSRGEQEKAEKFLPDNREKILPIYMNEKKDNNFEKYLCTVRECDDRAFIRLVCKEIFLPCLQKKKLISDGCIQDRFSSILSSKKYENDRFYCSFLESVSDIFAVSGKYEKVKEILTEIKKLYPYYVFSMPQTWRYCFGSNMEQIQNEIHSETIFSEKNLLSTLYEMMKGDKKSAYEFLVKTESNDEKEFYIAKAFLSILYSEIGFAEIGEKISSFYLVRCISEKGDGLPCLYTSLAYSFWKKVDRITALKYLQKIEKSEFESTVFYLVYCGVLWNCTVSFDSLSVKKSFAENFCCLVENNNYSTIILTFYDCFATLLNFADCHGFCPNGLSGNCRKISLGKFGTKKSVRVRFFGEPIIYADKEEIVWKTKKCKELFLLYMLYPDGIDKNRIFDNLWDGYIYTSAINNLKTTNNLIRRTLDKYGISYTFEYLNNRYKLQVERLENDYSSFVVRMKNWENVKDMGQKAVELNRLWSTFEQGFAVGCSIPVFQHITKKMTTDMGIFLQALVYDLIKMGDYIGAKRYIGRLEQIGFNCENFKDEIKKKVF